MNDATQRVAILGLIVEAIMDAVKVTGKQGAPAGVLYAAVMGHMTLDTFQQIMQALVKAGKLRKQYQCYFVVESTNDDADNQG